LPRFERQLVLKPSFNLIDGDQLCELLKKLKLGVTTKMVEEVTVAPEWFGGI